MTGRSPANSFVAASLVHERLMGLFSHAQGS
jgi:hypothetical protein